MVRGVIDRFEDNYAVVEVEGKIINLPKGDIPCEAKEGDIVIIEDGKVSIDRSETVDAKKQIAKLMDEVWED
jgi:hypothetical protein